MSPNPPCEPEVSAPQEPPEEREMSPSRILLHLLSISVSPSFLLAVARESHASLAEEIAQLRLAGAEDVEGAESGGLSVLSNYDSMVMRDGTYGEVKENIQGALLENVDTRSTTIQGGDSKGEQAPNLNQRISVNSVADFVKPAHKKLSEIDLVATGANESSEPSFMKDLREKKHTILELERQEGVFRQDVRFSNPIPLRVSPLPQANI